MPNITESIDHLRKSLERIQQHWRDTAIADFTNATTEQQLQIFINQYDLNIKCKQSFVRVLSMFNQLSSVESIDKGIYYDLLHLGFVVIGSNTNDDHHILEQLFNEFLDKHPGFLVK